MHISLNVALMFSITLVSSANAQTKDGAPSLSGRVTSQPLPKTWTIDRKLTEVQVPAIIFDDVPLRKAISELRQKAYEADVTEPDAKKRGINIVIKLDDTMGIDRIVSVHLRKGSLRLALEDLATAAKLKVKVEPYAVAFVPLSEQTDPLVTKEYLSPGDFFRSIQKKAGEAPPPSAKEILTSHGIQFPNGASAAVLPSGKLVVRNTEANLKAIEELMDRQAAQSDH